MVMSAEENIFHEDYEDKKKILSNNMHWFIIHTTFITKVKSVSFDFMLTFKVVHTNIISCQFRQVNILKTYHSSYFLKE